MPINLLWEFLFAAAIIFSQAIKKISYVEEVFPSWPTDYCPKTVLFPNMIRTGTK